ncbi:hypothetical protein F5883DRAFT_218643 [Diaporthe sp. PMI_573]|nr:hypothetical protein F5883DRAFT_218643 [Diaporthaceae sp. PMI_573]
MCPGARVRKVRVGLGSLGRAPQLTTGVSGSSSADNSLLLSRGLGSAVPVPSLALLAVLVSSVFLGLFFLLFFFFEPAAWPCAAAIASCGAAEDMISIGTHASQNGGHWVGCFEASVELRVLVARFHIHQCHLSGLDPGRNRIWEPRSPTVSGSSLGASSLAGGGMETGQTSGWPADSGYITLRIGAGIFADFPLFPPHIFPPSPSQSSL